MARRRVLKPTIGNWASGDGFFDRVDEVEDLIVRLERGSSVSLSAPRRVGKTSLLREVMRQLEARGVVICLFVDLEACANPEDAIARIGELAQEHLQLRARVQGWAQWLLGASQADLQVAQLDLREVLRVDWQTRGSRLIRDLCSQERPVVLFLDELPILVSSLLAIDTAPGRRNPADLFLSWLRSQVQEHRGLRVVLTGSIGLAPLAERAGLSGTLNLYQPAGLGPWSRDVSLEALHALAAWSGVKFEPGAAERVLDLLGVGVPYHLQLVYQAIEEDARRGKRVVIHAADVQRAWDRVLRNPAADLPHWEERLRKALTPPDRALAHALLTTAALAEPLTGDQAQALASELGASPETLRTVVAMLEHDGYLAQDHTGWYFPNRLVRAWWASRHGPLPGAGGRS